MDIHENSLPELGATWVLTIAVIVSIQAAWQARTKMLGARTTPSRRATRRQPKTQTLRIAELYAVANPKTIGCFSLDSWNNNNNQILILFIVILYIQSWTV